MKTFLYIIGFIVLYIFAFIPFQFKENNNLKANVPNRFKMIYGQIGFDEKLNNGSYASHDCLVIEDTKTGQRFYMFVNKASGGGFFVIPIEKTQLKPE